MRSLTRTATYAIARKELIRIRRDRRTLVFIFVLPVFMLLLTGLGSAMTSHPSQSRSLTWTGASRAEASWTSFTSGYFVRASDLDSYEEIERSLDRGSARVALVIPAEFGRKLELHQKTKIQTIVDGTDNNTASIALGYLTSITQSYSVDIMLDRMRRISYPPPFDIPALRAEPRVWYNPELKSSNFIVSGVIAIIIMLVGAILTAITIVEEKESGSIEPLIASPVRPVELVLGKLAPYVLFSMIDTLLIVAVAYVVFGVPIKGSAALLFAMALLYLTNVLGLGVLVSTLTDTVQSAMLLAFLLTLLPSILLSGFMFPLENMPAVLQGLSLLFPARYFLEIIRGIYLKGTGLPAFWPQVLFLAAFAAVVLLVSTLRLKKRLD